MNSRFAPATDYIASRARSGVALFNKLGRSRRRFLDDVRITREGLGISPAEEGCQRATGMYGRVPSQQAVISVAPENFPRRTGDPPQRLLPGGYEKNRRVGRERPQKTASSSAQRKARRAPPFGQAP